MPSDIRLQIMFDRHGHTVSQIKDMVSAGMLTAADADTIFGPEAAAQILRSAPLQPMPAGERISTGRYNTQVIVWGMSGTGKSAFIAALLSQPGMKPGKDNSQDTKMRIAMMRDIYGPGKPWRQVPMMSDGRPLDDYGIVYHKSWAGKRYPIILTEAQVGGPSPVAVEDIIRSDCEQVHLFCLDCSQDLQRQAGSYVSVLSQIASAGLMDHASGVYIIVTKTDLTDAPLQYRDNAAQALVTSGVPSLWRAVRDICYDKHIYNALPIAHSCGSFVTKDLARPSNQSAGDILHQALLPKCEPRRTLLGRLLSKGKRWQAALLSILLAALAVYGLSKVYRALDAPPTPALLPYDYVKSYTASCEDLQGMDYAEARKSYKSLRKDLDAESSLHTADGTPVLSVLESATCDSVLSNSYAARVIHKTKTTFGDSHWSRDEHLLRQLRGDMSALSGHALEYPERLALYKDHIDNYFDIVRPLTRDTILCTSLERVDSTISLASRWTTYPYENDSLLSTRLARVPHTAYKSYVDYLYREMRVLITDYESDTNFLERNPIFQSSRKRRLTQDLTPIKVACGEVMDRIEDKSGDEWDALTDKLETIYDKIRDYTFTIF